MLKVQGLARQELPQINPLNGGAVHYGLTGGWVQKFKASYLFFFLQCALTDYARGEA